MTRLEKRIEELGFDDIALPNGWSHAMINNEAKRVGYNDLQDNSYLTISFSKFLLTITRISWWDRESNRFNVWEPYPSEEHISIKRIEHILRGTISPSTNT